MASKQSEAQRSHKLLALTWQLPLAASMSAAILARTAHGLPLLELRDFERCILPGVSSSARLKTGKRPLE